MTVLQHTIVDGVLVSEDGFILDTGAPKTYRNSYLGLPMNKIAEHLGVPIAGIRGMDQMRGYVTTISGTHAHLQQTALPGGVSAKHMVSPVRMVHGVPVIRAAVNGEFNSYILDTGAAYSYLLDSDTRATDPELEPVTDFWPLVGTIETLSAEHDVMLGLKYQTRVRMATPYGLLEKMLELLNVDGILGSTLLERFDLVLDLRVGHSELYMVEQ